MLIIIKNANITELIYIFKIFYNKQMLLSNKIIYIQQILNVVAMN